ncbi:MAG: DNA/RNA helicase domain-containing protein [bacterium]
MNRAYYSDSIANFRTTTPNEILGALSQGSEFADEPTQKAAWLEEVTMLKEVLPDFEGRIYFEYSIPRMGKYIDVLLLIGPVIFVLEFKIGEKHFTSSALDQVCDYALDLKNFHDSSYNHFIAPVLIPTEARHVTPVVCATQQSDKLLSPIRCSVDLLGEVIEAVLRFAEGDTDIDPEVWESGRYCPTPTIIEAALALYKKHSVREISRNDAKAINLSITSEAIAEVIASSKERSQKSICFVTGVPGAGKTLVGLDTATKHHNEQDAFYSVFLSGNAPLVAILREALARDHVRLCVAYVVRIRFSISINRNLNS